MILCGQLHLKCIVQLLPNQEPRLKRTWLMTALSSSPIHESRCPRIGRRGNGGCRKSESHNTSRAQNGAIDKENEIMYCCRDYEDS